MSSHIDNLILLAIESIERGDLNNSERLLMMTLRMSQKNAEIFRLLGVNFALKKDMSEALEMFDRALKIDPNNFLCHSNRGNVLRELNKVDSAIRSYDRAITLQPNYAEAYNNRGNLFQEINKFDLALDNYEKAISIDQNYAEAYNNMGNTLRKLNLLDAALKAYQKAISLDGIDGLILGSFLNCKLQLCDWSGIEEYLALINLGNIKQKEKFYPFHLLSMCADPFIIKDATETYVKIQHPIKFNLGKLIKPTRRKKIRLGYFSPDFRNHAVSYLIAGMIESHDKDSFELIAFSMGPDNYSDEMRQRLELSFDKFIEISERSDEEVAKLSRDLEIDIAIDLAGFTQDARPGIFAYRVAPLQVGYLGYLGTMGAPYFDYLVADEVIIPAELRSAYSEKIIYLPSYQANDPKRKVADMLFSREELGLPIDGFIYCCFNNNYKINPPILDSWAIILRSVDKSTIFLHAENISVRKNILFEFEMRGISNDRVIFAERLPREEYLARYRIADLFLDTSPYNAGTTASDALWAGLPVLTMLGNSFASRVAGSLLTAIGLPDLITTTRGDYEALAIELALNPEKLASIKKRLDSNRLTTPLFDTPRFTRNLEDAYKCIHERYQNDLLPEHII